MPLTTLLQTASYQYLLAKPAGSNNSLVRMLEQQEPGDPHEDHSEHNHRTGIITHTLPIPRFAPYCTTDGWSSQRAKRREGEEQAGPFSDGGGVAHLDDWGTDECNECTG